MRQMLFCVRRNSGSPPKRGTEAEVLPSAAAAPRYVIEELSHIMDSQLSAYRITVRAPGLSNSVVVLQQSTAVQTFATK